jgi:hypothetical protein
MKKDILGNKNITSLEYCKAKKNTKYLLLQMQYEQWKQLLDLLPSDHSTPMMNTKVRHWYRMSMCAKKQIKAILFTLQQIRQEEWTNSKPHLLCIGKYGPIAQMTNPKMHSGPVAGHFHLDVHYIFVLANHVVESIHLQ